MMNDLSKVHNSTAAGNESHSRLTAYLRALQVTNPEQADGIVQRVMDEVAQRCTENPGLCLTAAAMDELHRQIEAWFTKLLGAREHGAANGLVLFLAIDAPRRWPGVFLADNIPADFQAELCRAVVKATPDLSVSRMVPQPFENPLPDMIDLPAPLAELARELSPIKIKLLGVVLVIMSAWSANRPM